MTTTWPGTSVRLTPFRLWVSAPSRIVGNIQGTTVWGRKPDPPVGPANRPVCCAIRPLLLSSCVHCSTRLVVTEAPPSRLLNRLVGQAGSLQCESRQLARACRRKARELFKLGFQSFCARTPHGRPGHSY